MMRITIAFQLKKSKKREDGTYPVYVRYTLQWKRVEMSTKVFVDKDSWDMARERVSGSNDHAKIIINLLDKMSTNILDIYNRFEVVRNVFLLHAILGFLMLL